MSKRWKWIAVACALLLGAVVVVAQGCGPDQENAFNCPDSANDLYDPVCCAVNGTGCGEPCDNPTMDLAICCNFFADCATDTTPDPGNCKAWYQFWCAPDGGAASAGPTGCAGDCVSPSPDGWSEPQLLWIGPAGGAPACPSNAPVTAYQGSLDLVAPDAGSCMACTCSIDGGSCSLPEHVTAGSGTCGDAGTISIAFDPPADWDGGCTDAGGVAAGALCENAACVSSLTAGPLALTPPACTPSAVTPVDAGLPSWKQAALACQGGVPFPPGCNGLACAPRASAAPGFASCIFQPGVDDCPASSPYSERHIVYAHFDDQRTCAPCTCGAPDASCTATLDVFQDDSCLSNKLMPLALGLTAAGASCGDLLDAGLALGSKQIDGLAYDAGTCTPGGGDAGGGFVPSGAATFCCMEST